MTERGSIWIIGDVQGCCRPLDALLNHPMLASDPQARFWFAGDLVNRGPDSLGALRTVMALGDRAVSVLGNHDLHLLAVAAGKKKIGKSDTIRAILDAPDAQELLDWLRHRPLAHYEDRHLMVHAGVLPAWTVAKTLALADELQSALRGSGWKDTLEHMYGNEPTGWSDELTGAERMRVIVNALTRMRLCNHHGHMEFSHKGPPVNDGKLMPWFDVPGRAITQDTIVFGHWSALGLMMRRDAICLDTGCVWGRQLTAMRLADRKLVQVACTQYQQPHSD